MLGRLQTENPHGDVKKKLLSTLCISSHESVGLSSHYRHAEGRARCWADATPSDASTSQQPPAQTDAPSASTTPHPPTVGVPQATGTHV